MMTQEFLKEKNNRKITCIENGSIYQRIANSLCKEPEDFCLSIKLIIDASFEHPNIWLFIFLPDIIL